MSGDTIHPARVFVVCAEGREAFAAALRRRLAIEQPEITFWQDHVELEGGIDWWGQVEKALDWGFGDHAPRVSVLSWSDDRRLRVWSLPTGERRPPRGHADSVHGALVLRDGRALSWSRDATPVNA